MNFLESQERWCASSCTFPYPVIACIEFKLHRKCLLVPHSVGGVASTSVEATSRSAVAGLLYVQHELT